MRVVGSRRAFDGRVISVRLDEIEVPSGRRFTLEIVEHPGSVAIVALTADGRVLLVRQSRPAVGGMLLELPAGTLERGEPPEACARRELAEETGHAAVRWEPLLSYHPAPGLLTEKMHLFLAQDLRPVTAEREEEDLTVHTMTLADARRRIGTGEIRDGKSIIGILLMSERLGAGAP